MRITVRLFASFRKGRFAEAEREAAAGSRVADLIVELGIPPKEVGLIMVDNRRADVDTPLEEGARLALFPLIGGG
jgi:sulfur carrier protein ThiS